MLGFLSTKLIAFINSKTEAVKKNIKNETVKTYIDVVSNTVSEVVQALNQEIVNGIKEASKDGKLTEDEAKEIKNKAIEKTLGILSDDAKETLTMVFGDLDTYISTLIESAVYKAKK